MSKRRSLTESLHLQAMAIQCNLAKIVSLLSRARCPTISSSRNMLLRRIAVNVIWFRQIGWWTETPEFEEVIDRLSVSLYRCRPKNLLVIVVDATLEVFDVDGHDPYKTFVVTTWIWYAEDFGPLYVVSLPSGLCFKVWTSL